jgi:hypothetical protein
MRKLVLALAIAIGPLAAFGQNASAGKIAELTAHRIDRLIALNKIDATFGSKLEKIDVSTAGPAPVAFRAIASQTQPAQGMPFKVELLFDTAGKALSFQVLPGGTAGPDPGFNGGQNAVALFENSLHYLLDNATDKKVAPFYNGLTSVTLSKGKLGSMDVSQAHIISSATTSKLNVYLMLDGMFMSAEIVP